MLAGNGLGDACAESIAGVAKGYQALHHVRVWENTLRTYPKPSPSTTLSTPTTTTEKEKRKEKDTNTNTNTNTDADKDKDKESSTTPHPEVTRTPPSSPTRTRSASVVPGKGGIGGIGGGGEGEGLPPTTTTTTTTTPTPTTGTAKPAWGVSYAPYHVSLVSGERHGLQYVDLSGNEITDAGAMVLADALATDVTMVGLSLRQNQLTAVGKQALRSVVVTGGGFGDPQLSSSTTSSHPSQHSMKVNTTNATRSSVQAQAQAHKSLVFVDMRHQHEVRPANPNPNPHSLTLTR